MTTKYYYSDKVNQNYQPSVVIATNKNKIADYPFDTSTYKRINLDSLKEKLGKYLIDGYLETAYKVYQYTFYPKDLNEIEKYNLSVEYRCFDNTSWILPRPIETWLDADLEIDFYNQPMVC